MLRSLGLIAGLVLVLAGCASRTVEGPRASWLLAGLDGQRAVPQFAQPGAESLAQGRAGQVEPLIGSAPAEAIVLVRFPTANGVRDWHKSDAYQQTLKQRADAGRSWMLGFQGAATKLPGSRPAFLVLRGELPAPTGAETDAFKQYGGVIVARLADGDADVLEGTPPKGAWTVVAFPSRGALAALWLDPDLHALRDGWNVAGKTSAFLIESTPH